MSRPIEPIAPAWAENASQWQAYLRGLAVFISAPGLVLCCTSLGFGALAREVGLNAAQALFVTASLYALPAQVLMIDQLSRGVQLATIALAVSLTAVRLLPMTVAMMPLIREEKPTTRGWILRVLVSHFIAVSAWLEGNRRLPRLPVHLRLAHLAGIGTAMLGATMTGTAVGYQLSGSVPPPVSAGLLFMTPLYFLFSLAAGATNRMDWMALLLGMLLGPSLFALMPGPDLLFTGLIGGTVAYFYGKARP